MKRRLFIGSSKEGLPFAEKLKVTIEKEFSDFIGVEIWTDGNVFTLNKGSLDALVNASRRYDYGILVATADDIRRSRRKQSLVPRDNVMFEMGMFLGSLGLTRAFLLVEKDSKLPTDYNGVTVPYFDRTKPRTLNNAVKQIIAAINNTKNSFNLKPVPSAALALGHFENFIQPFAKKKMQDGSNMELNILLPQRISDINTQIDAYKLFNPSEEESVYENGSRPRAFRNLADNTYWDIPTTLKTLGKLMDLVNPSREIGFEREKEQWIQHELRNFKGTLEVLISSCPACDNRVKVKFL